MKLSDIFRMRIEKRYGGTIKECQRLLDLSRNDYEVLRKLVNEDWVPRNDFLIRMSTLLKLDSTIVLKQADIERASSEEEKRLREQFMIKDSSSEYNAPPPGVNLIPVFDAPGGCFEHWTDKGMPAGSTDRNIAYATNDPNAFAVIVHGDSMAPKIEDGDIAVISPNTHVDNGNIVFCRCSEKGCTIKKYAKYNSHVVLRPLNPAYEEMVLTEDDNFTCYKVVMIWKKV